MSTNDRFHHRVDTAWRAFEVSGHRLRDRAIIGGPYELPLREALRQSSGRSQGSSSHQDAFVAALCCRAASS